ncbi:bacterio-opsin activator domain-containing protein [Halovivax cerinus]|uniref:Bacterio-opsin activator domain-containing protein n=1 Tax=Halovivax cerinus TaxID=1487865 RepID=A0ABD5NJM0_9EURY|nr:bacterio-opsin activator domain-containing protein [Halovivax cerinus]
MVDTALTRVYFRASESAETASLRDALAGAPALSMVEESDGRPERRRPPNAVDCAVYVHGDGLDGIGLLEQVRRTRPTLPVVLVAEDLPGDALRRAIAADVSGYVPRHSDDTNRLLIEEIERLVEPDRGPVDDGSDDDQSTRMPIERLPDRQERRLKERAMDEAPVGIAITDPDRPDNPLVYVNESFEELTGYPPAETIGRNCRFLQGPGTDPDAISTLRSAIDAEEPVAVELENYRADGEPFWNRVEIAPLHRDGDVTHFVGYQTDVTARKTAELRLERERETLDTILTRVNGLVNDVTAALVEAGGRAAAERSVCERIADTDAYQAAWIGDPDLATGRITVSAAAGVWETDPDEIGRALGDDEATVTAASRAYETGHTQRITDPETIDRVRRGDWFEGCELGGVVAIPLSNRDTIHGVLCVYATEGTAIDDREGVVLDALARATATTIDAIERGRLLLADHVVELEIDIRDPAVPLVALSDRTDTTISYEGAVVGANGRVGLFVAIEAPPAEISAAIDHVSGITDGTLVHEHDETCLFELRIAGPSIVGTIADHGGTTQEMTATDGACRVTAELATEGDARAIVEALRDLYDGVELVARRNSDRPPTTRREFLAELADRLTDKQREALQTAYATGYYDWNRSVSGDDLAAAMGVARSTYHQHRRAAERKLVTAFFDR